ncbi:MAG: ABC transporter substrate-binding protein [Ornithinimicrobium sp.]
MTVTVDSFGGIFDNYNKAGLLDAYMEENPNVTIEFKETQDENDYWTALGTKLNAGSGLADIQPIEISRAALVTEQQQDKWIDLRQSAESDHIEDYPDSKNGAITTEDDAVLGFGTDAGPMAICFRSDKLEDAGLPSTPEALSEEITDWDSYESLGQQYLDATGDPWMDTVSGYYRLLTSVEPVRNYDEEGEPTWDTNDTVKPAFMRTANAAEQGLTGEFEQFSQEWNTAMSTGAFATLACPAWMLGYIKQQAGDENSGNWSALPLPQEMGGNWGGSYLSVPRASKNAPAAIKLAAYLTSPESQSELFDQGLSFPSATESVEQASDVTDEYFSGAPIGEIFSASYASAPDQPLGVDDGVIDAALVEALVSVRSNDVSPDKAWETAVKTIENEAG